MGITLKSVSYSYQGKYQTVRAVNDVSYDFGGGKVYTIIGKSGSGKTTLLSLMAGLDLPVEGEIVVDGKSTKDWDRNRMRRDVVSVIYQNYNLFPLLTVQENIRYPLSLKKLPKKEAIAASREARARVELSESYDRRFPRQLSGGEQQRVAIARTLAQGCKIILADEPTGNLDSRTGLEVIGLLKASAARFGQTMVIVTHNEEIAQMADRMIRIEDGKVRGGSDAE